MAVIPAAPAPASATSPQKYISRDIYGNDISTLGGTFTHYGTYQTNLPEGVFDYDTPEMDAALERGDMEEYMRLREGIYGKGN
jgi:hypothetical protein